jgi:hypothetical protein
MSAQILKAVRRKRGARCQKVGMPALEMEKIDERVESTD